MVGVGYVLYPMALPVLENAGLVAKAEDKAPSEEKKAENAEVVEPVKLVDVDLTGVTPEDFPKAVELLAPVSISIPDVGPVTLKKGSEVQPIRLDGNYLIFKPQSFSVHAKIEVDNTNFKELIKPILDEKRRKAAEEAEKQKMADQDKAEDTTPEPEPQPEPQPGPQPEPKASQLSETQVVDLMKSSIAAGAVKEFKADQVLGWKLDGTETIDGKEYQIGLIIYNAETIFGVQKHEAKALISNGKVEKWIWAKTGVEIR